MRAAESVPAVSVVIPAYRAARTIGRAVSSVLGQTRPAAEVLVVDDGSPEELAPVLAGYGPPVRVLRQSNGGAASARNAGVRAARGDLIAFLDADDYWEPDKLDLQLRAMSNHPEVVLCASRYYLQPPGGVRAASGRPPGRFLDGVLTASGEDAFALATHVWTSTVLVRRDAIRAHSFQTGLEPVEDGDVWVRLVQAGSVYLHGRPLATAVLEPCSLSRTSADTSYGKLLSLVRHYRDLLGQKALPQWERKVLGRWARAVSGGAALGPAWNLLA
jgi:glycosyltransferase involved in cell wall biosynthesis